MASKKSGPKKSATPRKAAPENSLRMITVRTAMGEASEGVQSCKVYGVAKKAISKDTPYGMAHGIKGNFEVVNGEGKVFVSKRAFLPVGNTEITAALAAHDAVQFGIEVTREGEKVTGEFFVAPAPADLLESLRAAAAE